MSEPFLGQIEIFGFNFAPRNWAQCSGQLMAINQNQALFAVLGTTFGGDGIRTFALPDLRGRVPMGQGQGSGLSPRTMGETPGETNHTLTLAETPMHSHNVNVITTAGSGNTDIPGNAVSLSQTTGAKSDGSSIDVNIYSTSAPSQPIAPSAVGNTGGTPHSNMMPSLGLNVCIALFGIFPSRN
jgi:microcystin-dependent protein